MPVRKRQQWATAISGVGLNCKALSEDDAKRRQGQADGCGIFLPEVSDDESPGLPARAAAWIMINRPISKGLEKDTVGSACYL
jgi:hypothetical protein